MLDGVSARTSRKSGVWRRRSMYSPASSPSMPCRSPRIGPMRSPACSASRMTPSNERLMTAVGPPDWPTTRAPDVDPASCPLLCFAALPGTVWSGHARLLEGVHDRAHQHRQIGGLAGGDQVAVADDLVVHPDRPGVAQVVLDRPGARDAPSTDDVGR